MLVLFLYFLAFCFSSPPTFLRVVGSLPRTLQRESGTSREAVTSLECQVCGGILFFSVPFKNSDASTMFYVGQ